MAGKTALIIIDVQNDFLPDGALAVPDSHLVIGPIADLTRKIGTVVLTQDWHPAAHSSFADDRKGQEPFTVVERPYGPQVLWPSHCVQGTYGADIQLPDHIQEDAALIIRKGMNPEVDSYSAFLENDKVTRTGLAGWLRDRGIDTVVLCGLALDYCVAYSALDAAAEGFKVVVAKDACRAISPETEASQIAAMEAAGVRVVPGKADAVLAAAAEA